MSAPAKFAAVVAAGEALRAIPCQLHQGLLWEAIADYANRPRKAGETPGPPPPLDPSIPCDGCFKETPGRCRGCGRVLVEREW